MAVNRGRVIAAVFIEFATAFDSISHNILIHKMGDIGIIVWLCT